MTIIADALRSLYGQMCWGAEYEPILNLSFNIGKPLIRILGEPRRVRTRSARVRRAFARRCVWVTGPWCVQVRFAHWRYISKEYHVTSGVSSLREIAEAVSDLSGQRLTKVEVSPKMGRTRFIFDLGSLLEVRRRSKDTDEELWCLNEPSGYMLAIRANGTYDHYPRSGTDRRPSVTRRRIPEG